MEKAKAKKLDIVAQQVDNYDMPPVTDASTPVEFVDPKDVAQAEPAAEEVVAQADTVSADDLVASITANAQPGTIGHEIRYCIDRYRQDKVKHKAETKYRLTCLRDDAKGDEVICIDALLNTL